jgi:hypothetical protein
VSHLYWHRGARDFIEKKPAFAFDVAQASLKWLAAGHFYEVTGLDVYDSVRYALEASEKVGGREETINGIKSLVDAPETNDFVREQIIASFGRLRVSI